MSKKYGTAVAVLAAIVALVAFIGWSQAQEDTFFTQALQEANVPVPAGLQAKKLAYAKALAENNPLFALPGTDLDELDKDIAELKDLKTQTFELNASSTNAQLLHSLYQINFLAALSKLEHARRAFIASGSSEDETAYNAAAKSAFAAYQSDSRAFKAAFSAAVPENSGKFATDGDIIGRADILLAIDRLTGSAAATAHRFTAREQCISGNIGKCKPGDLQVPAIPVTEDMPVTAKQLAQATAVRALSAKAHNQPSIQKGPMLLLSSSQCAQNMGGAAPFFAFYAPPSLGVVRADFPLYVGNIRFNVADQSASPSFERFSDAFRQKISYVLNPPMLHYHCFELAHDSGKLFAMQDTYAFAQTTVLSTHATSSDTKAALAALEKKDLPTLSQREVESYLVAANTLPLEAAQKAVLKELSLSYLFNSAHFDANLGEILADQESNIALIHKGWPVDLSVPFMFFTRSSFAMLLLADNRSVTGTEAGGIQKLFPPNTIPKDKQPFIYYSDLPHTPAMIQTLTNDINFFYSVHLDPNLVNGLVQK